MVSEKDDLMKVAILQATVKEYNEFEQIDSLVNKMKGQNAQ